LPRRRAGRYLDQPSGPDHGLTLGTDVDTGGLYLDKPTEVGSYVEVIDEVCLKATPAAKTKAVLEVT
jgi:hypothetical protein